MRKTTNRSDWKDGFLFLGNELVLDFVNTRPVQDGEPIELLKDFVAVLRWFQAAGLLRSGQVASLERQWGGTARAQKVTEAMTDLREKLRTEILSWERAGAVGRSTIDDLNKLLADHPMRTKLKANGSAPLTELWFEVRKPEDLFAPLAHSAVTLLSTVDRKRVRKCARCELHFHDTSKKGTRRWCSMRLCGNRLKVAAYAARQRRRR
jgi:predicted RNA-binding Zn ribbon-like protein